jgi:glutaconate CoA-transferase subunit B
MTDITLAELCIVACLRSLSQQWRNRRHRRWPCPAACRRPCQADPQPGTDDDRRRGLSGRTAGAAGAARYDDRKKAGHLPFSRFFDSASGPAAATRWSRRRRLTALARSTCRQLGGTHQQPKTQMLGVRGFPGNTIYHPNSFFFPAHGPRVFVEGEVDMVSGVGYNPAKRVPGGNYSGVDLRFIVTNLCVMDFGGLANAVRVVSLHPGVTFDEVQAATGFALVNAVDGRDRPADGGGAGDHRQLDPHNIRAASSRTIPPARRAADLMDDLVEPKAVDRLRNRRARALRSGDGVAWITMNRPGLQQCPERADDLCAGRCLQARDQR